MSTNTWHRDPSGEWVYGPSVPYHQLAAGDRALLAQRLAAREAELRRQDDIDDARAEAREKRENVDHP